MSWKFKKPEIPILSPIHIFSENLLSISIELIDPVSLAQFKSTPNSLPIPKSQILLKIPAENSRFRAFSLHILTLHFRPGESCIYRIRGDGEHPIEVKDFHFDIPCEYGSISLISDYEEFGPFCIDGAIAEEDTYADHRRRRNAYGNAATDLQGHSYNSKEMDMVMTNGQRARFRFGFNFEFELLPGLPLAGATGGAGGMCPFKGIKTANAAFYAQYPDNKDANALFNELTESMYKFNCYFDRYRDQCKGNGPVSVGCHLMDFR